MGPLSLDKPIQALRLEVPGWSSIVENQDADSEDQKESGKAPSANEPRAYDLIVKGAGPPHLSAYFQKLHAVFLEHGLAVLEGWYSRNVGSSRRVFGFVTGGAKATTAVEAYTALRRNPFEFWCEQLPQSELKASKTQRFRSPRNVRNIRNERIQFLKLHKDPMTGLVDIKTAKNLTLIHIYISYFAAFPCIPLFILERNFSCILPHKSESELDMESGPVKGIIFSIWYTTKMARSYRATGNFDQPTLEKIYWRRGGSEHASPNEDTSLDHYTSDVQIFHPELPYGLRTTRENTVFHYKATSKAIGEPNVLIVRGRNAEAFGFGSTSDPQWHPAALDTQEPIQAAGTNAAHPHSVSRASATISQGYSIRAAQPKTS